MVEVISNKYLYFILRWRQLVKLQITEFHQDWTRSVVFLICNLSFLLYYRRFSAFILNFTLMDSLKCTWENDKHNLPIKPENCCSVPQGKLWFYISKLHKTRRKISTQRTWAATDSGGGRRRQQQESLQGGADSFIKEVVWGDRKKNWKDGLMETPGPGDACGLLAALLIM